MKKILLTFILAVSFNTYAGNPNKNFILKKTNSTTLDDGDKKLSVGLAVGLAAPLQEYQSTISSKDTTRTNGYAKVGFHYNVTVGYKFSKYIGAILMISGNINGVNTAAAATDLTSGGGTTIPTTGTAKSSGSHYVGQYLVGPYLSVPLTKKIFIEVRALVGLTNASYPQLSANSSYSYLGYFSFSSSINKKTNSGIGFGYDFGAGAKYLLSEHLAATLFIDYAGSLMSYKGYSDSYSTTETSSQTGTQSYSGTTNSKTSLKMSLGILNVSGGLAYYF